MNHVNFTTTNLVASRTFPAHWGSQRAGLLFRQISEPNHGGLPVLSVSIHDGISDRQLDDDERDRKVNLIEDRSSYQRVRPGYLAYNMMRAWQGAIGLSSVDGAVSPAYVVARPTSELHSSYYQYLLRTPHFIEQMRQRSKGIADFRLRLYWEQFKEILLPVPPLGEQRAIAEFLDRKTARIDQLIQKKLRLADLVSARWAALIHEARIEPGARYVRFGIVASRAQRAIPSSSENSYTPLGLLNRGRGFFKKMESDDDHLGDSDFFWVRRGDIVFSGQFAWEGAIGLVREQEDGCVVSHRYPVYRSNDGIEGAYLYAFFRTPHGAFVMADNSRGAAGRNRPLNTWSLERERILVPSLETQREIARLVFVEQEVRQSVRKYVQRATELRSNLISEAVTGQLDVRAQTAIIRTVPDRATFRLIVGAEIVCRHQGNPKFGRVKLQKELYLAEAYAGISELQGNYLREAAGPFDREMIDEIEKAVEAKGYYRKNQPDGAGTVVTYTALSKAGQHSADLKVLLGQRADALRSLIDVLRDLDRREIEAVATLYAVWNDALIDGRKTEDVAIINGVLNEWHAEKGEKFRKADLERWLGWMKRKNLVPRGEGPKTTMGRLFI